MMIFFLIFRYFLIFSVIFIQSSSVEAVMPEYLPINRAVSRNNEIENYFTPGFTASEILSFLLNVHGIGLSLRQLRRILKNRGCTRREQSTDMSIIARTVEEELRGRGSVIGYRSMHQRLTTDHQFIVTRNIVRQALKILDPEGVQARSGHRLRRPNYSTKGPNYLWHIDGYDKLKPFGFCAYGAIDGYSRKILWLEVSSSNKDPGIITKYFLDYVRQIGGTSRVIRADRGTENGNIPVTQHFFRRLGGDDLEPKRVSCMDDRQLTKELRLGGKFCENNVLTGGLSTLRI